MQLCLIWFTTTISVEISNIKPDLNKFFWTLTVFDFRYACVKYKNKVSRNTTKVIVDGLAKALSYYVCKYLSKTWHQANADRQLENILCRIRYRFKCWFNNGIENLLIYMSNKNIRHNNIVSLTFTQSLFHMPLLEIHQLILKRNINMSICGFEEAQPELD